MEAIFFYLFSTIIIISSLMVITRGNPISSAIWLVLTFFCTAAVFVLLHAHLIAVLQVTVYAGAIMVLFIFVIMLLSVREEVISRGRWTGIKFIGVVLAGLGLVEITRVIKLFPIPETKKLAEDFGTIESVGIALFTDYLLPFEITSILLLIAIVGAVVLAKRRD